MTSRNIASLELYRATEDTAYHDVFAQSSVYADGDFSNVAWNAHQFEAAFLYATMGDLVLNETIRATGLADIEGEVNLLLDPGQRSAFGNLYNPYAPYGWGNTAPQPNHSSEVMIRLHHLTGREDLVAVIQNDVQYALGANPLNMTYMTGLDGVRGPEELLNLDAESLGYDPVPGITVYGDFHIHDYGWNFYHDIMYSDMWPSVWEGPVSESWQGYSIYVPVTEYTVQQGILDMSYVTGYLSALNAQDTSTQPEIRGTAGNDTLEGSYADDLILGLAGADTINGKGGDDVLMGDAGNDKLYGGDGNDEVTGGAGNDLLKGNGMADRLQGKAGSDTLFGGGGSDFLDGGTGRD